VRMTVFVCNHCGMKVKNNGGSAREIGMIELDYIGFSERKKKYVYYHYDCAKEIAETLLDEI